MKNETIDYGRLIINADDFGISHEVNKAIIFCLKERLIDRTTLMVNMPYTEEAVQMAKENRLEGKVGLHVNLVEGNPLSERIKSTSLCTGGEFNGSISSLKYKMGLMNKSMIRSISDEIDAQMKRFITFGLPLRHVDSHQHTHIKPPVLPTFLKLAERNGFNSIRIAPNILLFVHIRSLPALIYKKKLNRKIISYNVDHNESNSEYPLITRAGGYLALKRCLEKENDKLWKDNIEMWFHPSWENEKVINLYYNLPFDLEEIEKLKAYRNSTK